MSDKKSLLSRRLALMAASLLVCLLCTAVRAMDADELLEILRQRDARFDDASLQYEVSTQVKIEPFPYWKFPDMEKPPEEELNKVQVIGMRYAEQLTVRDGETTFEKKLIESKRVDGLVSTPQSAHGVPYMKWNNLNGRRKEIVNNSQTNRTNGDMTLDIFPDQPQGMDIAQEQRTWVELAHGYGLGKKITKIDSVTQNADGTWEVKGQAKIWSKDQTRFAATIDQDFVVRKLEMNAKVGPVVTVIKTQNDGSVEDEGLILPQSGSFSRTSGMATPEGELAGPGQKLDEFSIAFRDLELNISDARYLELTDMSVPDGTQVSDRIADVHYIKGELPALPLNTYNLENMDSQAAIVSSEGDGAMNSDVAMYDGADASELMSDQIVQPRKHKADSQNWFERRWPWLACGVLILLMLGFYAWRSRWQRQPKQSP